MTTIKHTADFLKIRYSRAVTKLGQTLGATFSRAASI
jgi:hypothetical protein